MYVYVRSRGGESACDALVPGVTHMEGEEGLNPADDSSTAQKRIGLVDDGANGESGQVGQLTHHFFYQIYTCARSVYACTSLDSISYKK